MSNAPLIVHLVWTESDGTSTKLLTTSYAVTEGAGASGGIGVDPFNCVTLYPLMSGTAVTSLELLCEISPNGTDWNPCPTQAVAAGTITVNVGEASLVLDGSGRTPCLQLDLKAARYFRVSAKRTGGDATSSLLLRACFGVDR